ncbi:hypothetical protein C8F04DRAFT_587811 [Mycena alexandri]|uniref:Uncharacterized protein n=1 Tax=Mycena alexandri TaxID=1745969 RepID=A0AAD6TDC2_9AGAR|nr:hypothetical protein C8F04DRAFT_587811 [Mycena alexandri]
MDLPTPRELELETLLRQRDTQVSELGDEVTRLRKYVLAQPEPSITDPISLPPALTALLLPHLNSNPKSTASTSSTAALTQRTRLLQEENDELYQLLRQSETGKLKEEVRGLRRLVERLEGALRESHQVVVSLSTELEKSYEAFLTTAPRAEKSHSRSPRNSYHVALPAGNGNASSALSNSKLPPTGPRAHKKPRLSESHAADAPPSGPGPSSKAHHHSHSVSTSSSSRPDARISMAASTREQSPRPATEHRGKANHTSRMDVDEPKPRPRSPAEERDKDGPPHKDMRHKDRERRDDRDRDRERDRDGGRRERRNGNGNFGGGGGRGSGGARRSERGPPANNAYQGADRTLKERLGL